MAYAASETLMGQRAGVGCRPSKRRSPAPIRHLTDAKQRLARSVFGLNGMMPLLNVSYEVVQRFIPDVPSGDSQRLSSDCSAVGAPFEERSTVQHAAANCRRFVA
jgi:hypothetical protein